MALGTAGALMLAGGAFQATNQIMGAQAQAKGIQRQAEYNAKVYDQQAQMIREKKKIADYQFARDAARARGKIVSQTAGKGLLLSGSPLAVLVDNETQMQFDKSIQDYNFKIDENFAMSSATNTRAMGAYESRAAKFSGYSNAFSTALSTASNLGQLNLQYGQGRKV